MNSATLRPGDVLMSRADGVRTRVILCDQYEIMYDVLDPTTEKWHKLGSLNAFIIYYRGEISWFVGSHEFVDHDDYSEDICKVIRPDLPLRLCRNKDMFWTGSTFDSPAEYQAFVSEHVDRAWLCEGRLELPEVYLAADPLESGMKKPVLVRAADGNGFSYVELMWHAQNIQSSYQGKKRSHRGVGIYRLGHLERIPSYAIMDYYHPAGIQLD